MPAQRLAELAARLRAAGVRTVESYAWRDLDDPDAGGSEVHAHEILSRWSSAGVPVVHRTSASPAGPRGRRTGYEVVRRGGRYGVFPRVILRRMLARRRAGTAVVEIWNGVPWFSPIWSGGRGAVWLHHLHDDMWRESLPWPLSVMGRILETRIAPVFYRNVPVMTLAESTAVTLVERGFPAERVAVVHPGIAPIFAPNGEAKTAHPSVVAVGRLAPVKRFDLLIDQFARVLDAIPDARLVIVGTGPLREDLESRIRRLGLGDAVRLAGRVDHDELVSLYSRSWLLASASHSEGWGMTITEAAACGTPAVVSVNHGHRIAVKHRATGVLVDDPADMASEMIALISDRHALDAMARTALESSRDHSWDEAAVSALRLLVEQVEAVQRR